MIHVPTAVWAHFAFDGAAWATAAIVSLWLYRWRLGRQLLAVAGVARPGYFICLGAGALLGAWIGGSLNTVLQPIPALSHSALGGLCGAIAGVEAYKLARQVRGSTGVIFAGPFSAGIAVGRWGCLFAGLKDNTYGRPTHLPWAVDLGDGIGRHPVQIYESLSMALFFSAYVAGLARRAPWAMRRGFYVMCVWYGAQRFVWEFMKPYPVVLGPLNLFQIYCVGLVIYGGFYYVRDRADDRAGRAQIRAVSVPGADHQPV